MGAKSRVAPLKQLSIPRLELEAALLGSRLAKNVIEKHSIKIDNVFMWSDSKTVLCWLISDHRLFRQFVANRVSEIMDLTKIQNWRWIPTKYNVADDATKWSKQQIFDNSNRWFTGPEILYLAESEWPEDVTLQLSTKEEIK